MKTRSLLLISVVVVGQIAAHGATVTWDAGAGTAAWSTPGNWNPDGEPTNTSEVVFPAALAGAITTTATEQALSLRFDGSYTLSGGTLALATGNSVAVADGATATLSNSLSVTGGLTKAGGGTLVLGASNTNPGGTTIAAGILRAAHTGALGTSGIVTTVQTGATLEIGNSISLDRPVTLRHGATLAGSGSVACNGVVTLDAAATAVTLATGAESDVLTVGNGTNDLTGGTSATVISPTGPGTVRLGAASNFDGTWNLTTGRLELGNATALGDTTTSSVTLAGGTLSARLSSAANFATGSQGNHLLITADSAILSDRASSGVGVNHTFGSLAMAGQTLTVSPGSNATSGTAGITLGDVTLTGNPGFQVTTAGSATAKLTTGSLLGGGIARTITKTGGGGLAVTGGATDLPAGSVFTATGGGTIEMLFANLGSGTPVAVDAVANPFGGATVDVNGGGLRLLADGNGTSTAQTYQVPTAIRLGGTLMLDANRRSGSGSNKTFELTGLTLAAGTDLTIGGDNTHGFRLTGPLALEGNATLRGPGASGYDSTITLAGGITGGPADALTITGGVSPPDLTISGSSTYGGGTSISGGTVALNAANALGSGPLALSGGTVTVATDGAIAGAISMSGGTLRVNGTSALAGLPLQLAGGTLDLRTNTTGGFGTGAFSLAGTATLNVANNGTGSSHIVTIPSIRVASAATLALTNGNSFVPNFSGFDLEGDLTLSPTGTSLNVQVQSVTEDGTPRKLVKSGAGVLKLQGANTHTGGTEVLAGTLELEHSAALGSGGLALGDLSGTATATVRIASGLTVSNSLNVRSGGTGLLTLDTVDGGVVLTGLVDLQRSLTIDNGGGTTATATLSGVLGGSGDLAKTGPGPVVLGNVANSFGSGSASSLAISQGALVVASDGALGNPANGVTVHSSIGSSSTFRADGGFATSRTLTFNANFGLLDVTADNTLTFNGTFAGTGVFTKTGAGVLDIGAGATGVARGTAETKLGAGTLRLRGPDTISLAGPLTFSVAGATLELLGDAPVDIGHPVNSGVNATILTDREASGTGGHHRIGSLSLTAGTLTVNGANGYGLEVPAIDLKASSAATLINQSATEVAIGDLTSTSGTASRTFTLSGSGDIRIEGAISQSATGGIRLTKSGTGTVRFGTSVSGFGAETTVSDGTLDLNGLSYTVDALVLGGASNAVGPRLVTGAGGTLQLNGNLTSNAGAGSAPPFFEGTLGLSAGSHSFNVPDNTANAVDLEINGAVGGPAGATLVKTGSGTVRTSGAPNTLLGPWSLTGGTLLLNKTGGDAIGAAGITVTAGTVRLEADEQIANGSAVALNSADEAVLDLDHHTETVSGLSMAQTDSNDFSAVRTGSSGTLVLEGNLQMANNTNSSGTDARQILITGSGTENSPVNDGTLDLGGAVRTVQVTTTTTSQYAATADATIETRVVNGGILKTGARALYLTHPANDLTNGLAIAEGTVFLGPNGSVGGWPVTISSAGSATLQLSQAAGSLDSPLVTGGTGTTAVSYTAAASGNLTLGGAVTLGNDLTIDVATGGTSDNSRARLQLTGAIGDGAGTFGLVKTGNGTLLLSGTNSFDGGVTVRRGVVGTGNPAALGAGGTPVTLDGGCFQATGPLTISGNVLLTGNGGTLHSNSPTVMELAGLLDWGTGSAYCYGSGATVLSGTTTGTGDLTVGAPGPFAASHNPTSGFEMGHRLSLRGMAALPSGNLHLVNNAVLELGNGDFTRPLGTGPGEVQLDTYQGAGWSAFGADRAVNLGGAGATLVWGQPSPAFLYRSRTGSDVGALILGSSNSTHTVDLANPIELNNGDIYATRTIRVPDGPAATEARMSGGLVLTPPPEHVVTWVELEVDGALDISGPLVGPVSLYKLQPGTVVLSGSNSGNTAYSVWGGTLVIAGDASFGAPEFVDVGAGALFDAGAMTVPVDTGPEGSISLYGNLTGDVRVAGELYGDGVIDGDVTVPAGGIVYPNRQPGLTVNGDFELAGDGTLEVGFSGMDPYLERDELHVNGSVTLGGTLSLYTFPDIEPVFMTDPVVLVFNDGEDPVNGTFAGLPEGALIPIDGGNLRITYQANGDGGAVGNDIGFTWVANASADLALTAAVPLTGATGAGTTLVYTVSHAEAVAVGGAELSFALPPGVALVGSTPPGTVDAGVLTIPLPDLPVASPLDVVIDLTLPGTPGPLGLDASVDFAGDPEPGNNTSHRVLAVLPDGRLELATFERSAGGGEVELSFQTMDGVRYRLEASEDLANWQTVEDITGNGEFVTLTPVIAKQREFFRVTIIP
ncbi:MAG: autotransporter-associated beta strand repeat-containing protein [Verrucomicrobia bacterium]|nr:autotransporter-associated beta strand repeat-containing protein [Verrucomicrobiota bacterium]